MKKRIRSVGVEIEFFGVHYKRVLEALALVGITCDDEVFGPNFKTTSRNWKLVADRSVTPDETGADRPPRAAEIEIGRYQEGETVRRGLELVSPIMWDKEHAGDVKKVLKVLKTIGAQVNETCGIHFHIGVEDFSLEHMKELLLEMARREPFFDAMSPIHRRENNNKYCKSIRWDHKSGLELNYDTFEEIVNACTSLPMLQARFAMAMPGPLDHSKDPKYKKLNIKYFFKNQTVEFRHMYGSLDHDVVSTWLSMYGGVLNSVKERVDSKLSASEPVAN